MVNLEVIEMTLFIPLDFWELLETIDLRTAHIWSDSRGGA